VIRLATRPNDPDRGTCANCPASREGCLARQQFARERCCRLCTHPAGGEFLVRHAPTTPADMGHTHIQAETIPEVEG